MPAFKEIAMALDERKILDFMVKKFNYEYIASHDPENFLIYPIQANTDYQYGFEAKATLLNTATVRFRIYFSIGPYDTMSKFKLSPIDDIDPAEDYAFVSKGNLDVNSVTDDSNLGTLKNYDGSGIIDPTENTTNVTMVLGTDEW